MSATLQEKLTALKTISARIERDKTNAATLIDSLADDMEGVIAGGIAAASASQSTPVDRAAIRARIRAGGVFTSRSIPVERIVTDAQIGGLADAHAAAVNDEAQRVILGIQALGVTVRAGAALAAGNPAGLAEFIPIIEQIIGQIGGLLSSGDGQ